MTTQQISHVNLQYSHTIGRGEQFGPGFTQPQFVARGEGDLMYVLCRGSEYRPEGTRITVCTVDEEFVNIFARGLAQQGPHEFNLEDGSLAWPTCIAISQTGDIYVSDEWLNRITIFNSDGEYPSLEENNLLEGDLHFNNDFRSLYTSLLEDWMDLDAKPIVNGSFEKMALL